MRESVSQSRRSAMHAFREREVPSGISRDILVCWLGDLGPREGGKGENRKAPREQITRKVHRRLNTFVIYDQSTMIGHTEEQRVLHHHQAWQISPTCVPLQRPIFARFQ